MLNTRVSYKSIELINGVPTIKYHFISSRIGQNSVWIKPLLVGICRSDIKELKGDRVGRRDFGHEIIGTVMNENTKIGLNKNDVVVFNPNTVLTRTSGFAEIVRMSGSKRDLRMALYKVTPPINFRTMVFTEPLSSAEHCIHKLCQLTQHAKPDKLSIGIIGAGEKGTLIGLLAKYFSFRITVYNRRKDRLNWLQRRALFASSEMCLLRNAREDVHDVIILTTTFLYPEVLKRAIGMVKPKGILLLFGGTKSYDRLGNINIDSIRRRELVKAMTYDHKEFTIAGSHGILPADMHFIIRLLQRKAKSFQLGRLLTKEITLESLPKELIYLTSHRRVGKVIVNVAYKD